MQRIPAFSIQTGSGRTTVMRLIVVAAVAAALAACASTKPSAPPVAAKAAPAKATVVAAPTTQEEKFAVIDATNIAEAQAAGFKVVNDGGTPLFCKKEQITGTRTAQRTVCLTAAEMQERARAGRDSMKVEQVPYMGPQGGR
jgi:predicted small lipoprotein YifL